MRACATKAHCLNECTLFVLQKGLKLYQSCLLFCGKSTSRHRLPYYYIIALYNCVMLSSPKLISSLVHHIDSFRSMVLCVCVCLCLMPKYLGWIADVETHIRRTYKHHTKHCFRASWNSNSNTSSNIIIIFFFFSSRFNCWLIIVLRECKVKVRACAHAIRSVHI